MTTPAEELKPGHEVMTAAIRYGASSVNRAIDGNSAYFFISQQVRLRDALITAQAADIEWLTAKRDELRALIASQAADIAALKALLQSAYARSSIEEGSPLSIKINAALRGDTDHDHR